MQIIYADVLLAVNFSMDFLSLYLTGRILHRPLQPGKLFAASIVGGIYGVAALFLERLALVDVIVHVAVSLLMCFLAYGKPIVGTAALFYGIGFLLGGGMTAAWTVINRWRAAFGDLHEPTDSPQRQISPAGFAALALLCAAGAVLLIGLGRRRRMAPEAALLLAWADNRYRGRGIVDSANFLTEPVSGAPVILLSKAEGKALLPSSLYVMMAEGRVSMIPSLPLSTAKRVRLVPLASAGGEKLIAAVRPDRCEVDGVEKEVYIGIGDVPQAMIPADLVKGSKG